MSHNDNAPLTRQELYDRIRQSSKDEYILSEMIRLGYWNEEEDKPSLPAQLIKRQGELQKQLNALIAKQNLYENPEQALKVLHKQRKQAARKRREQTRQKNNEARYQRALRWYKTRQSDIVYLGKGVSAGLQQRQSNRQRLTQQGLPQVESVEALAAAMGVNVSELRFLTFDRKTTTVSHYQRFLIAKKTGGTRLISAPMPRLKRLQYWVLGNILEPLALHDAAHGFISGRSIVSNAMPHVGKKVVINMDLQDFFPTINYKRIKGLFVHMGYSEQIATVLALLCSEPDRDSVTLDTQTYHIAKSTRHLPQGAPTSPAISNLICRRLDKRIKGMADKLGFTYSRYADDLSFSFQGKTDEQAEITKLLWRVRQIVTDEGFIVHPQKTRVMHKHQRQEVTGIVVNEKLSISRQNLKRFRALLFQIDKDGPEGKTWGQGELFHAISGYANYVMMVNPEKGRALKEKVMQLRQKYRAGQGDNRASDYTISPLNKKHLREQAIAGKAPVSDWWQTTTPAPPVKEQTPEQLAAKKREEKRVAAQQTTPRSGSRPTKSRKKISIWRILWWAFLVLMVIRLIKKLF